MGKSKSRQQNNVSAGAKNNNCVARENFEPATQPAPAHSGSKWLKPAENKFIQSALTSFSMQISANLHSFCFWEPALQIQNLSNQIYH